MTAKMLYIDIETSALNVDTWSPWESNAIVINRNWQVLGFSYAWDDGPIKNVYPHTIKGVSDYFVPANEKDEKLVLAEVWRLLDEADIVVAHNGDKFDLKKINARLIYHGFGPPTPYRPIDTLKVAKKHFAFTYNRLDWLAQYFGFAGKLKHDGYPMWQGCMTGDKKSWQMMAKYNKQDIEILRQAYKRMREWMTNHPHVGGDGCPTCGTMDATRRGNRTSASGLQYTQLKCKNCGAYYKGARAIKGTSPAYRA